MTDIVDADIPLILSKASIKKCNMIAKCKDFENDTAKVFAEAIPLSTTCSGLYALPITKSKYLIDDTGNRA